MKFGAERYIDGKFGDRLRLSNTNMDPFFMNRIARCGDYMHSLALAFASKYYFIEAYGDHGDFFVTSGSNIDGLGVRRCVVQDIGHFGQSLLYDLNRLPNSVYKKGRPASGDCSAIQIDLIRRNVIRTTFLDRMNECASVMDILKI